jgi:hypothetical protein
MKNLISSLAVFRELYNIEKNIYDVLKEFIKIIITDDGLFSFTSVEITNKLKATFDFKIPEAVVKTTLKRLPLKREFGKYTVDQSTLILNQDISKISNDIQEHTSNLLSDLYRFIETKTNKFLIDSEKQVIEDEFYNFLLDETDTRNYSTYIASYIIEKESELFDTIRIIREGLILYSGINYYDINNLGNWQDKLTIYMDTEVIFDMAGYNGSVYKLYFDEFYNYVKEINSRTNKLISLKYLNETKKEIYTFFDSASEIVSGKRSLQPQKSAMASIVNGCKTKAAVIEKRADLFTLMNNNQIELEERIIDLTKEDNFHYNILDKHIVETLNTKLRYEVYPDLMLLNNINMRRNVKENGRFSDIGYIFLTGNKNIMNIAFDPKIRKEGTVPLATTLEWLTNKFWFKMNKGFGQDKTPHNTNIFLKSQVVLSSIISESVDNKYKELMKEFKDKNLSKELVQNRIIELRKMSHKPEDIVESNINQIFDFLTEKELERAINEKELLRTTVQEQEKRNIELQQQIENSTDAAFTAKNEALKILKKNKELQQQIENSTDAAFTAKNEALEALKKNKETSDITHKKILRNIKIGRIFVRIICLFCIILFLTLLNMSIRPFTNNQVSGISFFMSILCLIISILKIKKIDMNLIINKIIKKIEENEYKKNKFNLSEYTELTSKIETLKKELNRVEC